MPISDMHIKAKIEPLNTDAQVLVFGISRIIYIPRTSFGLNYGAISKNNRQINHPVLHGTVANSICSTIIYVSSVFFGTTQKLTTSTNSHSSVPAIGPYHTPDFCL